MHELSIASAIVETACEAVEPGCRVLSIKLQLGPLCGVVEDSLRFCFELATAKTPLEGCTLEIEQTRLILHCASCADDFEPEHIYSMICPLCQCPSHDMRSGRELLILSLEVEDEPTYRRAP